MNKTWVEVNNDIAGVPPTTSIDLQDADYEYAAQWYHDSRDDSWISTGWHGDRWGSKAVAEREVINLRAGIWQDDEVRLVRRVKAGPIEVVDGSA